MKSEKSQYTCYKKFSSLWSLTTWGFHIGCGFVQSLIFPKSWCLWGISYRAEKNKQTQLQSGALRLQNPATRVKSGKSTLNCFLSWLVFFHKTLWYLGSKLFFKPILLLRIPTTENETFTHIKSAHYRRLPGETAIFTPSREYCILEKSVVLQSLKD